MALQTAPQITNRILRQPDVVLKTGVSSTTLWRWTKAGHFPKPIKLGPNVIGWREADIDNWINERAGTQT